MKNVYEQVDSNKRKSFLLILGFIIFISLFGYFFTYLYNYDYSYLLFALGFSFVGSFTSFYYSDKIALSMARAEEVTARTHQAYISAVQNISQVAQIPVPRTYVIPSHSLNAFATGRDPDHAAIAVTQGLLDNLDRTELEGVIAHEISHISNYDTRLMTVVAILVGSIAIIMNWSFRFSGRSRSRNNNKAGSLVMILGLLLIILSPIVANLIKLAISRRREFYADAQGVKFTRQPSGLIGALRKIAASPVQLSTASPATAHMYISNPLKHRRSGQWFTKMFSTHPPVKERIAALEGQL